MSEGLAAIELGSETLKETIFMLECQSLKYRMGTYDGHSRRTGQDTQDIQRTGDSRDGCLVHRKHEFVSFLAV